MGTKQQGITFISLLLGLIIVGAVGLFVLRVTPVYIQYYTVAKAMDSLKSMPTAGEELDPSYKQMALKEKFMRQLSVNSIASIRSEQVVIKPEGDAYSVHVAYDVQVPLLGNIDLLIHFDKTVVVPK